MAETANTFRNVDEVRDAVVDFKDCYNREWRLEKLGFMSPLEARQARMFKQGRLSPKTVVQTIRGDTEQIIEEAGLAHPAPQ